MIKVSFTENHPPYVAGDIAGFNEDEAKALVALGVAKVMTGAANKMVDTPPAAKSKSKARRK